MSLSDLIRLIHARIFRTSQVAAEIEEELQAHIDCRTEDLMRSGLSREDALRRARIEFGCDVRFREETHKEFFGWLASAVFQDIRFGLRMLRKAPGFTISAILMLGLGIGATTAVFSILNAVLLKPLPFPEAERIVIPWNIPPAGVAVGYDKLPWDPIRFHAMQEEMGTYRFLAAFESANFNLTGAGDPALLEGQRVTSQFFSVLGISPAMGRIFTAKEDAPGSEHEVILGDSLWRERFHADTRIIGQAIDLNGSPYTVIGVMPRGFNFPTANEMPEGFSFPSRTELWVPAALPAVTPRFTPSELAIIGRLHPGVSIKQAQTAMDLFAVRMDKQYPQGKGFFHSRVMSLAHQIAGDTQGPLLLILSAVGVVLLIVCFNLTSLLLTRSIGRNQEFSLRVALGAGKTRILRQLLIESLLLSLAGGMIGVAIGFAGVQFIRTFGPSSIPRLNEASIDLRVLSFVLAVTLLTAILMGFAPALVATRSDLIQSLRSGGQRSGTNPRHLLFRNELVMFQIALALVLVVACGLLVQTFAHLLSAGNGLRSEHVLTFEMSLPNTRYPDKQRIVQFYREALPRLRAIAGVRSAAMAEAIPMGGAPESTVIRLPGKSFHSPMQLPIVNYTITSPGFFRTVGSAIRSGRDFLDSDNETAEAVTVINQSMAQRFWPNGDALGKKVVVPSQPQPMTIVGVVNDIKHNSLAEAPVPEMFVPYTQDVWPSMSLMQVVMRTYGDPDSVIGGVRVAIRSVDSGLPLAKVTTLSSLTNNSLTRERFSLLLMAFFGGFSILLAALGVYGVISYSVSQQTREVGVRMALGAPRKIILRQVLYRSMHLAMFGICIGIVASLGAGHILSGYLFGVRATDPLTFAIVSVVLSIAAVVAGFFPARRAASIDPMKALRLE